MEETLFSCQLLVIMLSGKDLNQAPSRNSSLAEGGCTCVGALDLALLGEYSIDAENRCQ